MVKNKLNSPDDFSKDIHKNLNNDSNHSSIIITETKKLEEMKERQNRRTMFGFRKKNQFHFQI